jgi:predicted nucleic acid-binding protein
MNVVSNATPIISLATIEQMSLLSQLFGQIHIPRAVYQEVKSKKAPGYDEIDAPYIHVNDIQGTLYIGLLRHDLDRGEAEAIVLAKELNAETLIIDERTGYLIAKEQGLHVIGTLTVLLMAKEQGVIPVVKPLLDKMMRRGRWYSQFVYTDFLRKIGE